MARAIAGYFTKGSLLIGVAGGVLLGGLGLKALYAQAPAAKPLAYYVAEFEPTDPEAIKPYSARVASTFEPFGGRFIVRGGRIAHLEGEAPKGRLVVIEFDNMEKAQAWYDSPAYVQLRPIRYKAGKSRVFILEGTPR